MSLKKNPIIPPDDLQIKHLLKDAPSNGASVDEWQKYSIALVEVIKRQHKEKKQRNTQLRTLSPTFAVRPRISLK
jgi:hypothetical protein